MKKPNPLRDLTTRVRQLERALATQRQINSGLSQLVQDASRRLDDLERKLQAEPALRINYETAP